MPNYINLNGDGTPSDQCRFLIEKMYGDLWAWRRTVRGVIAPLCVLDGLVLIFWAWTKRSFGEDANMRFLSHWGVGVTLAGIIVGACGLQLLWASGVHDVKQVLRERVLAYEFSDSNDLSIWSHISMRSNGGVAPEASRDGGSQKAPVHRLYTGFFEHLRCFLLLVVCACNGFFFWRNFNGLPERDPHGRLNLAMHVVAWAELLGFGGLIAKAFCQMVWAIYKSSVVGGDHFHKMLVTASWCDSCASDLRFARRFSALQLLSFLHPEDMIANMKENYKVSCKGYRKEGAEYSQLLAFLVALMVGFWWVLMSGLGLYALTVRLNQVAFVTQTMPAAWTRWDWFSLFVFVNNLLGLQDSYTAGQRALASALADATDEDVAAADLAGRGSRFSAWRRNVLGKVVEERGALSGVALATTMETRHLAALLFRAKTFKEGDSVVAVEPCGAPIEAQGVLRQLEPLPMVEWAMQKVHGRVMLKGLQKGLEKANGTYEYSKLPGSGASWPIYIHEDKGYVLVPEIGDLAQPRARGWSLTPASRLIAAKGGDPPRYCGIPSAWSDGEYSMDPTKGQWFLNDFSGVGHSAKDAITCIPWREEGKPPPQLLPARWGVSLAQIRREKPYWRSEEEQEGC